MVLYFSFAARKSHPLIITPEKKDSQFEGGNERGIQPPKLVKRGLTGKSSLAWAPRDSLRATAEKTVCTALRTRFCISRVSTRSVFHTFPLS